MSSTSQTCLQQQSNSDTPISNPLKLDEILDFNHELQGKPLKFLDDEWLAQSMFDENDLPDRLICSSNASHTTIRIPPPPLDLTSNSLYLNTHFLPSPPEAQESQRQDYFSHIPAAPTPVSEAAKMVLNQKEILAAKRAANKSSARKSRKKKQQSLRELEDVIENLETKNNSLLLQLSVLETEKSLWTRRESEFDARMKMMHDQLRLVTEILKNQQ